MPLDAEFQNQYAGYHPGTILRYQLGAVDKVKILAYHFCEWFLI